MSNNKDAENNTVTGLVGLYATIEAIWTDPRSRPSRRAFLKWRDSGLIPFLRIGRLIYYDVAEVRKALNEKCTVSAQTQASE
jgi:hypothetical protein